MLDQHDDVYLGRFKEHFYFNREYDRGLAWYQDRYSTYDGQRLVGDITPSYFRNPASYDRIHELAGPDVRAILVLRQPIIRAWSHYNHQLLRAKFDVGFTETFDHPLINVDYVKVVERFQANFGSRGLVLIYEDDVAADPLRAAQLVGDHLGISISGVESRWSNRGLAPRYVVLEPGDVVGDDAGSSHTIATRCLVLATRPELSTVVVDPSAEQIAAALRQEAAWTRTLDATQVTPLTASVFGDVVATLEGLLNRSLASWVDPAPPSTYQDAPIPVTALAKAGVITS